LISSNFETLQTFSATTEGDKIIITGSGVLRTASDDTSINNNLKIDETGLQSSIQRTGSYIEEIDGKNQLNMKFKPVYGVALDDTSLSVKVEEGAQFESSLPFEKKGDVYYLSTLPDEMAVEYTPAVAKKSEKTDAPGLIIFLLAAIIVFFIMLRKNNKK